VKEELLFQLAYIIGFVFTQGTGFAP